jgi:pumilio family protein 6
VPPTIAKKSLLDLLTVGMTPMAAVCLLRTKKHLARLEQRVLKKVLLRAPPPRSTYSDCLFAVAKAKESRQEKKRQASERRQGKPLGDVIYRSKKIWEQIRRKDLSKEERKRKIEEHQQMIRGNIKDLVFKHDASRVVQTALKYGSKSIREEIAQELKGTFVQLAQSSYGKYLVVKVMHYGTPETKMMVVEEFCGHVQKLIKHREASFVIEDCFREFGTPEQKARLVREFYGAEFTVFAKDRDSDPSLKKILEKSPEKRAVIMKNIFGLLKAVVEKGALFFTIVHKAMLEFISNTTPGTTEATEFIELVKEHAGEISFTKDGSQVIMRCLALGNAKVNSTGTLFGGPRLIRSRTEKL